MTPLKEPAPYAEGNEIPDKVVCRLSLGGALALTGRACWALWLQCVISIWLNAHLDWQFFLLLYGGISVLMFFIGGQTRTIATEGGLHVHVLANSKFIPWEEVTSYALHWPAQTKPPVPLEEGRFIAALPASTWRFLRLPRPEELAATIYTKQGPVTLGINMSNRESLCRMVRQYAVNSKTKDWRAPEYEILPATKEFVYVQPASTRPASVIGVLGFLLLMTVFWFLVHKKAPLGSLASRFVWHEAITAVLFAFFLLPGVWWFAAIYAGSRLRRELSDRLDEKITLTETDLTWEKGTARINMPWEDIIELRREREWTLVIPRWPWLVRSPDGEFRFYSSALAGGRCLPAVIYNRCPQLWGGMAPIAEAGGREDRSSPALGN